MFTLNRFQINVLGGLPKELLLSIYIPSRSSSLIQSEIYQVKVIDEETAKNTFHLQWS